MTSIKFMTYNVWSCEHVAVYRRIQAICEIIERHDPDVVVLQEVTDYIYSLFQEAPWWENYYKFPSKKNQTFEFPFCLQLSKLDTGEVVLPKYSHSWAVGSPSPPQCPRAGEIPSDLLTAWVYKNPHRLRTATCCLAGPTPSCIGSVHRRATAGAFLEHFDAVHQPSGNIGFVLDENVVLGGDLGWDDDLDELRGRDGGGWTYDVVANPMLRALNLPAERRRPDRFICKLRDFTLGSIEMVGVEPIPGVTRFDDKGNFVPVFPSHHFGLLLTITPKRKRNN